MELGVATVLAILGVALLVVLLRFTKSVHQGSDEEWRRKWQALDANRRKAIRRSMRRGEPVHDREDAELSLRSIAQVEHVRRAMGPIESVALCMFVVMFWGGLILNDQILAIGGVLGSALIALGLAASALLQRRFRQSAEATRRLTHRAP
jgi:hypothetical protein